MNLADVKTRDLHLKYCHKCGRKLITTRTPVRFSASTGKLLKVQVTLSCPLEYSCYDHMHTFYKWFEDPTPEDVSNELQYQA